MNGGLASISLARLKGNKNLFLPKVRNFNCVVVDKQVFWFQVSVEVILFVHVAQCLEGLEHNIPDHILWEQLLALFHQLVHVHIKKFKDEM